MLRAALRALVFSLPVSHHSNDTGLHTLWDLLWSVLMQLFLHPGTLATEL